MAAYGFDYRGFRFEFSDDENSVDIFLGDAKQITLTHTVGKVEWAGDVAVEVGGETAIHKALTWVNKEIRKGREPKPVAPAAEPPTAQPIAKESK